VISIAYTALCFCLALVWHQNFQEIMNCYDARPALH